MAEDIRAEAANVNEILVELGLSPDATISSVQRRLNLGTANAMRLLALRYGISALSASLAAAQAEFAAYIEAHNTCVEDAVNDAVRTHDEIEARRDGIEAELKAAQAEITRLQGYVQHKANCGKSAVARWRCTCGLETQRTEPKEPTT